MQLYYYHAPEGNFGDDLNLWLWPQLVPGLFDKNDGSLLIGIGTLLNHRVPEQLRKIVLGAGVGYGPVPQIDDRWDILSVRGPLSAFALGLDEGFSITDPAVLIRTLGLPKEERRFDISFMPHHANAHRAPWRHYCQVASIRYIDPRSTITSVLKDIRQSRLVVTEAMHGAIVADALRIPWIPVRMYESINTFKWHDWCQSLGISYAPIKMATLIDRERSVAAKVRRRVGPAMFIAGLKKRLNDVSPFLSQESRLDEATERLLSKVEELRSTYLNHSLRS